MVVPGDDRRACNWYIAQLTYTDSIQGCIQKMWLGVGRGGGEEGARGPLLPNTPLPFTLTK